jgi:hypothetical protein
MEANQSNLVKAGEITKKTLEEAKRKSESVSSDTESSDEFNVVTYIEGERLEVGRCWMNSESGQRPKIQIKPSVAPYLSGGRTVDAWFYPKNKRKKEDKK